MLFSFCSQLSFIMLDFKSGVYDYTIQAPDKSAKQKIIFLFLKQNICCGYSNNPSR